MNNIKVPTYPQDFNFPEVGFGVKATDSQINMMIKDGIEELQNNQNQQHAWASLGITHINIERLSYDGVSEDYYYDIEISHNVIHHETNDITVIDKLFGDIDLRDMNSIGGELIK